MQLAAVSSLATAAVTLGVTLTVFYLIVDHWMSLPRGPVSPEIALQNFNASVERLRWLMGTMALQAAQLGYTKVLLGPNGPRVALPGARLFTRAILRRREKAAFFKAFADQLDRGRVTRVGENPEILLNLIRQVWPPGDLSRACEDLLGEGGTAARAHVRRGDVGRFG